MVDASSVTTAAGGTVQDYLDAEPAVRTNLADPPYNGVASTGDQSALVQSALDNLASNTRLEIPAGIKFRLRSLSLPKNVNIEYSANDDLDANFYGSDIGSGERVYFSSHSSYDAVANPNGGVVNEWRFTAPFHPGLVVDVRKDVPGGDGYLAPDQNRLNPARASFNIQDEQSPAVELAYSHACTSYSRFDGVRLATFRRVLRLQGIAASAWTASPTLNAVVTGTKAGVPDAKGYFLRADTNGTVIDWISGSFVAGMTLSAEALTASGTVARVANDGASNNQTIAQHNRNGLWACGAPPGSALELWTVGGDVSVTKTIDFGQHIDEAVTLPGYVWRRDLEGSPNIGVSVRQTSGESDKRLWIYDGPKQSANPRGMLGAVSASVAFNWNKQPGGGIPVLANAINIAAYPGGITNPATGRYRVHFKRAMASTEYAVQLTPNEALSSPSGSTFYILGYAIVDASNVDILVSRVNLATGTVAAADLPVGAWVSVTVCNGDI